MPGIVRRIAQAFYDNRNYRFWAYQLGGWSGYSLATFLSITVMDNNVHLDHVAHIGLQAILGVLCSWPLRPIYRKTFPSSIPVRVVVATLAIVFFSAVWTAARIYTFTLISGETGLWHEFHYWFFGSLFVFLSWTVLYYGIHYYELLIEEHQKLLEESALREKERARRLSAESEAREAQLRMLRYQLNPHFLFNTLNAVNAHVRLGETGQASEMIQHLSSFLRHALEQDAVEDVALWQELDSLRMYLDIVQARFGERLAVEYRVDAAALDALVPSLILQPIVENAMKYAVAESEEGGTVEIGASLRDDALELKVLDSGPGIPESAEPERRGIGLRNTLERLRALYRTEYRFTIENREPTGLAVTIRIPHRSAATALPAGSAS